MIQIQWNTSSRLQKKLLQFGSHAPFPHVFWHTTGDNVGGKLIRCVVMELFETDMAKMIKYEKVLNSDAASIVHQVGVALAYMHSAQVQVVHLDVKPANVLWRQVDRRVVLADFSHRETIMTNPRFSSYCTANYRPPELWQHTLSSFCCADRI